MNELKEWKCLTTSANWSGKEIKDHISNGALKVMNTQGNPVQRDYSEWSPEMMEEYIETVVTNNFPHTSFYLVNFKNAYYVVDGQHRLMTIYTALSYKDENNYLNLDELMKNELSHTKFDFKIIHMENNCTEEDLIKHCGKIFDILNNKREEVAHGALVKAYLRGIDSDKSNDLFKLFSETFSIKNNKIKGLKDNYFPGRSLGEPPKREDEAFDIIGLLCLFEKYSDDLKNFYTIKTISSELENLLSTDVKKEKETISRILDNVSRKIKRLKELGYSGNRLNRRTSAPAKNYLLPFYYVCEKRGVNASVAKKIPEAITTLLKSEEWDRSNKNTRAPQMLALLASTLDYYTEMNMENIIESFLKAEHDF